ncbi:hypothetical protein KEM55_002375 [Ascosphaera atra]|nr:hypothetical protein KEM55_002375 [Ascosphaera atra]
MPFGFFTSKNKQAKNDEPQSPKVDSDSEASSGDIPNAQNVAAPDDSYLQGREGHLSSEQIKALDEFKSRLEKDGYYRRATEQEPASHDDSTLLRFLRARRFEINGGINQFKETEDWRKHNKIEKLYADIDIDSYEESRRMYPQWTGRRDYRGIPVYLFVIKHLNSKNMASYIDKTEKEPVTKGGEHEALPVPNRLLRLFALYENMTQFVTPLCSSLPRPHPETPVVSTTNIVDISGVGLKQFWNLKGHMQDASVLATAHYPETLDRIFVVWSWIKRWFDPVTTSKIFILSEKDVKPTLLKFMPPDSFPKQYGGELDFDWTDMPHFDEPARQLAGALERINPRTAQGDVSRSHGDAELAAKPSFLVGPVKWLVDRLQILGTVGGATRRRTVTVAEQSSGASAAASATASAAAPEPAEVPNAAEPPASRVSSRTKSIEGDGQKTVSSAEAESSLPGGESGKPVHVDVKAEVATNKGEQ